MPVMEMAAGAVSYDRIAARYEQVRGGVARARQLASAVVPWLVPGSTVCDVGAGTGIVTELLYEAGMRVAAFDVSVRMLRRAAARLRGRVAVADAVALPLADVSVDAVVYVWVLHHVGDLAAALSETRRVLRPGGRAVCISGLALPLKFRRPAGNDPRWLPVSPLSRVGARRGRVSRISSGDCCRPSKSYPATPCGPTPANRCHGAQAQRSTLVSRPAGGPRARRAGTCEWDNDFASRALYRRWDRG